MPVFRAEEGGSNRECDEEGASSALQRLVELREECLRLIRFLNEACNILPGELTESILLALYPLERITRA